MQGRAWLKSAAACANACSVAELSLAEENSRLISAEAFRERFVSKTFCANLEKAAQRYEKWIESRSPGHIAAMREFMKQMRAQTAKAA